MFMLRHLVGLDRISPRLFFKSCAQAGKTGAQNPYHVSSELRTSCLSAYLKCDSVDLQISVINSPFMKYGYYTSNLKHLILTFK